MHYPLSKHDDHANNSSWSTNLCFIPFGLKLSLRSFFSKSQARQAHAIHGPRLSCARLIEEAVNKPGLSLTHLLLAFQELSFVIVCLSFVIVLFQAANARKDMHQSQKNKKVNAKEEFGKTWWPSDKRRHSQHTIETPVKSHRMRPQWRKLRITQQKWSHRSQTKSLKHVLEFDLLSWRILPTINIFVQAADDG